MIMIGYNVFCFEHHDCDNCSEDCPNYDIEGAEYYEELKKNQ